MNPASLRPSDLVTMPARSSRHGPSQKPRNSRRLVSSSLAAALGLYAGSRVLPEHLAELAADLMSWCLVLAVAGATLLTCMKVIESLLDA